MMCIAIIQFYNQRRSTILTENCENDDKISLSYLCSLSVEVNLLFFIINRFIHLIIVDSVHSSCLDCTLSLIPSLHLEKEVTVNLSYGHLKSSYGRF